VPGASIASVLFQILGTALLKPRTQKHQASRVRHRQSRGLKAGPRGLEIQDFFRFAFFRAHPRLFFEESVEQGVMDLYCGQAAPFFAHS
jgi:hypothetical protein